MKPPLQQIYDLSNLSAAGAEIKIAAKAEELPALAQWLGVDRVTRFEARVDLEKLSQTRFAFEAGFIADVVQACVADVGVKCDAGDGRRGDRADVTEGPE